MFNDTWYRRSYWLLIILLMLGGVAHCLYGFANFDQFDLGFIRFQAQGLLAFMASLLNLSYLLGARVRVQQIPTVLGNLLMLVFVVPYLTLDREPQGFVMLGIVVLLTLLSLRPVTHTD